MARERQCTQTEHAALVKALDDLLAITRESQGVIGWHLNDAVADWGEFEAVAAAEEIIAKEGA